MFGFQNDSDIWLGECEWALVQEQRSMLTPINVPLNGKCVRRLITIVVEMVGDLEKAKKYIMGQIYLGRNIFILMYLTFLPF